MGDSKAGQDLFSLVVGFLGLEMEPFPVYNQLLVWSSPNSVFKPRRGCRNRDDRARTCFGPLGLYKDCGGAELEPVLAEATGACSELILY